MVVGGVAMAMASRLASSCSFLFCFAACHLASFSSASSHDLGACVGLCHWRPCLFGGFDDGAASPDGVVCPDDVASLGIWIGGSKFVLELAIASCLSLDSRVGLLLFCHLY